MKPNATATVVADNKPNLSVVTPKGKNTDKKFPNTSNIETVEPIAEPKAIEETPEPIKVLSIEELKNKTAALEALTTKHDALLEQMQKFSRFEILHEESQAKITIEDVNGLKFSSTNPKSIADLVEIWNVNFEIAKTELESKIRAVYEQK